MQAALSHRSTNVSLVTVPHIAANEAIFDISGERPKTFCSQESTTCIDVT